MLNIQILVKNNEDTIKSTLESIISLESKVVIGNLGCSDKTTDICLYYGAEIVEVKEKEDYSKIRNSLASEGLNFYIEPWEILASGHEIILNAKGNQNVYVINNGILSKEIRIWENAIFSNPVYESISDDRAGYLSDVVLVSKNAPDLRCSRSKLCKAWLEKNPTSPDPYYYMALSCLAEREYKDFYNFAGNYLAMNKDYGVGSTMIRYYMSQIEMHTGNLNSSANNLLRCMSMHPEMAEFWCLLGDMLYKVGKYERAESMYENAIIAGRRRRRDDPYPVEIAKYGEYPRKMLENIKRINSEFNLIGSKM